MTDYVSRYATKQAADEAGDDDDDDEEEEMSDVASLSDDDQVSLSIYQISNLSQAYVLCFDSIQPVGDMEL